MAVRLGQIADGRNFLNNFNKYVLIYGGVRAYTELMGLTQELRTEATLINDVEVFELTDKITLKFLNKYYPEVYTGIKDFDLATQRRFYDDFLNLANAETVLGGLELNPTRVSVWKSFENETFLAKGGAMRERYIRDLGIVANENVSVLEEVITWRSKIKETLVNNGLDINLGDFATTTNIGFCEISYIVNGEQRTLKPRCATVTMKAVRRIFPSYECMAAFSRRNKI